MIDFRMAKQLRELKYSYTPGNNPAGEKAYYHCSHCDLELHGEAIGYVGAGSMYANGEHAPCPSCGEENSIERDEDEDVISVATPYEDAIKEELWNRFMENMKMVVKHGEEPILPSNFLGSVEKHRLEFMKIDISDLTK
jgi:hypothetical protein